MVPVYEYEVVAASFSTSLLMSWFLCTYQVCKNSAAASNAPVQGAVYHQVLYPSVQCSHEYHTAAHNPVAFYETRGTKWFLLDEPLVLVLMMCRQTEQRGKICSDVLICRSVFFCDFISSENS